ncbi:hypothetical protein FWG95_02275 [Candidatus Saccharibacteria bacterium]|nr:hypothetical protein [Candidatus Saccharibacteria bacterium]
MVAGIGDWTAYQIQDDTSRVVRVADNGRSALCASAIPGVTSEVPPDGIDKSTGKRWPIFNSLEQIGADRIEAVDYGTHFEAQEAINTITGLIESQAKTCDRVIVYASSLGGDLVMPAIVRADLTDEQLGHIVLVIDSAPAGKDTVMTPFAVVSDYYQPGPVVDLALKAPIPGYAPDGLFSKFVTPDQPHHKYEASVLIAQGRYINDFDPADYSESPQLGKLGQIIYVENTGNDENRGDQVVRQPLAAKGWENAFGNYDNFQVFTVNPPPGYVGNMHTFCANNEMSTNSDCTNLFFGDILPFIVLMTHNKYQTDNVTPAISSSEQDLVQRCQGTYGGHWCI